MFINNVWVGWGLGDNSKSDDKVRRIKHYMRAMYKSYAGGLADTNVFDEQMLTAVLEMQRRLVESKKLVPGHFLSGVLDEPTQVAMEFMRPRPKILPIIFTLEGHMSNMFFGPAAGTAETLQNQGVCRWKPCGYNSTKLPFDKSGSIELYHQVSQLAIEGPPIDFNNPDGPKVMWPFGPEVPWGVVGFSRGSIDVSDFMETYVLPTSAPLHWRLASFKRGLALGNPRREKGKVCSWAVNPPAPDTSGILDKDFITTGTAIADKWQENAHAGDMFADNKDDKAGQDKTAVARIITQNSWLGGQTAIFTRVLALMGNPTGEALAAIMAIVQAIMFAVKNPNPHYATVTESGDIEWMRGVAA